MPATAPPVSRKPVVRPLPRPRKARPAAPRPGSARVNVGQGERWASVLGGGVLGLFGLSRGDLSGLALAAAGGALLYRGLGGHCHVYQALNVNTATPQGRATSVPAGHGVKVQESVTVQCDPAALYRFWRNLENLGHFMEHLESVRTRDGGRSHWTARGPLGVNVEWDAEIHNEKENELIAWRSVEGSAVDTAGSVHFLALPHGRGTEVRVVLKYDPPAGKVGETVAWLMGKSPRQQIHNDLRKFKQHMEAGEVATTAGQPRGDCR